MFGQYGKFLPYIKIYSGNSGEVASGKMKVGCFGICKGKEDPIDIGKSILAIPIAWRPTAMNSNQSPPLVYHNKASESFQTIMKRAMADSNSGNMYGPEFLLWLDGHGFVTFFHGSKTARNAATAFHALLPTDGSLKVGIMTSEMIKNDQYTWFGPKIELSSQTMQTMPSEEETMEAVSNFLKAPDSQPMVDIPPDAKVEDR